MYHLRRYTIVLIIFLCSFVHFGYGQDIHDIQHLYVNNLTNITLYRWLDDSLISELIFSASDSFSILSFDITRDEKNMILSEGIPYRSIGDDVLDPDEDYCGIGSTNLILVNLQSGDVSIIDTVGGPYGEGARWVAKVRFASTDSFFYALIGGWEWNSLHFYSFPDVVRLPDIPFVGDGVSPICWSEDGKVLYAYYFYHGDPDAGFGDVVGFDLAEQRSEVLGKPLDSIVPSRILLLQGVGSTETDRRKRRGIWSPDGLKTVTLQLRDVVIQDAESEEQKVLLEYDPIPLYKYMPAKDTIRVIWK
jgi:hypothetical protein